MGEVVEKIHQELRLLWRDQGGVTVTGLAKTPLLVETLLSGRDLRQAFRQLQQLSRTHQEDRWLQAAFAGLGLTVQGETVLDRLTEFAERFGIEQRTARRWADDGLKALALLIVESNPVFRPICALEVSQVIKDDGRIRALVVISLIIMSEFLMNELPTFILGADAEIEKKALLQNQRRDLSEETGGLVRVGALYRSIARVLVGDEARLEFGVEWEGETYARYDVAVRSIVHGYSVGSLYLGHSVSVNLSRDDEATTQWFEALPGRLKEPG